MRPPKNIGVEIFLEICQGIWNIVKRALRKLI